MEEAPFPDEFPERGAAQAGRGGLGGRAPSAGRKNPAAGHAELWTRPHGSLRHGRKLALADAATRGRQVARDVLYAIAALAGHRFSTQCHGVYYAAIAR